MIKIEFTEDSTFTFNPHKLSIQLWEHKNGQYSGPIIGQVGEIAFANRKQVREFVDMAEFILKYNVEEYYQEKEDRE